MDQWKVRHSAAMFSLKRAARGTGLYDYDGREYQSVVIGSQEWLASNYSPLHYADGTPIDHCSNDADWAANAGGAWCYYDNNQAYLSSLGRLYNQHAVLSASGFVYLEREGIMEVDWRVPQNADIIALAAELGGFGIVGGKLKSPGTTYWASPNVGATNSSGFTSRAAGVRDAAGGFAERMLTHNIWLSDVGFSYQLEYGSSCMYSFIRGATEGVSVRLVRDI
jgi:uncharacterized protein (TIGR02145 family)